MGLGITGTEGLHHETAINADEFVVIVIGSDRDMNQVHQILYTIGHKILKEAAP